MRATMQAGRAPAIDITQIRASCRSWRVGRWCGGETVARSFIGSSAHCLPQRREGEKNRKEVSVSYIEGGGHRMIFAAISITEGIWIGKDHPMAPSLDVR